jgi:hypothetical protein
MQLSELKIYLMSRMAKGMVEILKEGFWSTYERWMKKFGFKN